VLSELVKQSYRDGRCRSVTLALDSQGEWRCSTVEVGSASGCVAPRPPVCSRANITVRAYPPDGPSGITTVELREFAESYLSAPPSTLDSDVYRGVAAVGVSERDVARRQARLASACPAPSVADLTTDERAALRERVRSVQPASVGSPLPADVAEELSEHVHTCSETFTVDPAGADEKIPLEAQGILSDVDPFMTVSRAYGDTYAQFRVGQGNARSEPSLLAFTYTSREFREGLIRCPPVSACDYDEEEVKERVTALLKQTGVRGGAGVVVRPGPHETHLVNILYTPTLLLSEVLESIQHLNDNWSVTFALRPTNPT
jgi:hypothetical protein